MGPATRVAGALAVVAVGSLQVACGATAGAAVDRGRIEAELFAAIGAKGQDYRRFRDGLLARGAAIRPVLADIAKNGKSWQERVMAGIVLERSTQPERTRAVVDWWAHTGVYRATSENLAKLGRALAKQCEGTPMLLVEKIWKGNELRKKGAPGPHDGAWAADALGWLSESRAVGPLILVLEAEYKDTAELFRVATAARALGKLGDGRAVPSLCRVFALYSSSSAAGYAYEALRLLVDAKTSYVVERHASWLSDGPIKSQLLEIAKRGKTRPSRLQVVPRR